LIRIITIRSNGNSKIVHAAAVPMTALCSETFQPQRRVSYRFDPADMSRSEAFHRDAREKSGSRCAATPRAAWRYWLRPPGLLRGPSAAQNGSSIARWTSTTTSAVLVGRIMWQLPARLRESWSKKSKKSMRTRTLIELESLSFSPARRPARWVVRVRGPGDPWLAADGIASASRQSQSLGPVRSAGQSARR